MSELRADSRAKKSTAFWRFYMLSWAVLSGSALVYLTLQTTFPGGFDTNTAKAPDNPLSSGQVANRADAERERLNAQVRSLNKTVASLRSDLARIKQSAAKPVQATDKTSANQAPAQITDAQRDAVAPQGVSQITTAALPKTTAPVPANETEKTEPAQTAMKVPVTIVNAPKSAASTPETTSPVTVANPPSATASTQPQTTVASAPPTSEKPPTRRRNLATTLLRPGSVPPLPPYNQQANRAVINPLSNNSADSTTAGLGQPARDAARKPVSVVNTRVATAPSAATFGTPVVKPRPQPATLAALSLSTAQSVTGLRASWLLLTTRHPNIFVGYQPRYIADQANGNYRLIAGPIANHSDADRICTQLRAQNVSCGVTAFVGSAL